jgi:putative hydrolase of the HAD superfamily
MSALRAEDRHAVEVVAFDGDDTLWHNERLFALTQERFQALLEPYAPGAAIDERLFATEMRNLRLFGYGIKGFVLSMIETAIELTEGRIAASDIQTLIESGKAMLQHPVELLDGVRETLDALRPHYKVMLITKGDLFDQESKIARSGLTDLFWRVEILSEKDVPAYRRILAASGVDPARFVMVGNSLRSDVLPVLELGGWAVHIPYHLTWAHEVVAHEREGHARLLEAQSVLDLPGLLASIEGAASPVPEYG